MLFFCTAIPLKNIFNAEAVEKKKKAKRNILLIKNSIDFKLNL